MVSKMYARRGGGVFSLIIVLDKDFNLLCFCTPVEIHVRKWSWCVLFVNTMSQCGYLDRLRNYILPVGSWWCMNRLFKRFWNGKVCGYCWSDPLRWFVPLVTWSSCIFCQKILGNTLVRLISSISINVVRDISIFDIDRE